jgi:hypothetical protein
MNTDISNAPTIMTGDAPPSVTRENYSELAKEAESRKLEYDPAERAKYVRNNLELIRRWKSERMTRKDIGERIPQFVKEYPTLFEKATEPNPDIGMINGMLAMLDHMSNGKINQHQASVIIGKALHKKYIVPITGNDGVAEK